MIECDIAEDLVQQPTKRPTREGEDRLRRKSREPDDDDDRPHRQRRDREDDYDEPRRSRRDYDDDEDDEYDRPIKRRRKREPRQVPAPSGPFIFAIIACVFSCIPLAGLILGIITIKKADEETMNLPRGPRYDSAHSQMRMCRLLGMLAIVLSFCMCLFGAIIQFSEIQQGR